VIFIAIPVFNEAPTIGVMLWRIRKVFQEFPREYRLLVFDDGSTDATGETLTPYTEVLPLTVLGGREHVGYGRALESLCRGAAQETRYARRDAVITMQGDFTDQPEHIPELVKRFEGGADIVVAEQAEDAVAPPRVRRLRKVAPWILRPFVATPGVRDPFGAFRLFRVSVLRDAIKGADTKPLIRSDGWAANVDLLLATAPHARRTETVNLASRYDVRPRDTRVRPLADAMRLYRFGRAARISRPAGSA
jgi:glycosyltransferase involved in cell wall biosynthesis